MIFWLYDLLLLFALPFLRKKRHHYRRLFAPVPDPQGKEVIWIHAVSVGETKAAQALFQALRASHPNTFFLITSTTATGLAESHRSLAGADAFAYIPIDLSWIVNKWVKAMRPKLFLLIEGDIWPNLLRAIKKQGGKTALVSGKLSERSAKRFSLVPRLSKKLFALIDQFSVQNEEQLHRFLPFVPQEKISVTGNLKWDYRVELIDAAPWRSRIPLQEPIVTLACTHTAEEELLLDQLPLDQISLFLVPRHPERFEPIAQLLQKRAIPFIRWSRLEERRGGERVVLVDAMGQLPICYSLSRLSIVAGSFVPGIGGHNVLEPCFYGVPVLFGPYTFSQTELVRRVLESGAGWEVAASSLRSAIETFFSSQEATARKAAQTLTTSSRGVVAKTLQSLSKKEKFVDKSLVHIE